MKKLTKAEKQKALLFLEDILKIPTVNNSSDETALAAYIKAYFEKSGIFAELCGIDATRSNVVAEISGRGLGRIVLNGHLDTVPYGSAASWETNPKAPVQKKGRLYARGASDMKSGLAAMVFALCLMNEKGKPPRESLSFFGTADEEKGGLGAKKILEDSLMGEPDLLIVGEPTGNNLGVAQKGCVWIEVKTEGKTSHGAYPWEGVNAAELGFKLVGELKKYIARSKHPVLGNSTAELTKVEGGGVAPNMVPDKAVFIIDVRNVPTLSQEKILKKAETLAKKYAEEYKGFKASFNVLNRRMAIDAFEFAQNDILMEEIREAVKELSGQECIDIGINFFTDASILTENSSVPTVLFGPGEPDMAHKPNEYVEVKKYFAAIETFINVLY